MVPLSSCQLLNIFPTRCISVGTVRLASKMLHVKSGRFYVAVCWLYRNNITVISWLNPHLTHCWNCHVPSSNPWVGFDHMSLCCIPTSTVRTNPFVCRTNQVESLSWLLKSAINPHCSLVNVQFSSDFCSSTLHVLCFSPFFTYFVGHISYKSPWRCDPWSIHVNSPCFLVKFPWFFSLSCSINLSTPMPSISPSIPKEGILRNSLSKDVDLRLHLLEPRPGCSEIAQCCGAEDRVVQQTHGCGHHLWWLTGEPPEK